MACFRAPNEITHATRTYYVRYILTVLVAQRNKLQNIFFLFVIASVIGKTTFVSLSFIL